MPVDRPGRLVQRVHVTGSTPNVNVAIRRQVVRQGGSITAAPGRGIGTEIYGIQRRAIREEALASIEGR